MVMAVAIMTLMAVMGMGELIATPAVVAVEMAVTGGCVGVSQDDDD